MLSLALLSSDSWFWVYGQTDGTSLTGAFLAVTARWESELFFPTTERGESPANASIMRFLARDRKCLHCALQR